MKLSPRFLWVAFALSFISLSTFAQAKSDSTRHEDDWFGQDKIKHFTVSGWIVTVTSLQLQDQQLSKKDALYSGIALSLATGIGKEIYDSTKPDNIFSYRDLVWDILGISFFTVLITSK